MSAIIQKLRQRSTATTAAADPLAPATRSAAPPITIDPSWPQITAYGITIAIGEITPQIAASWLERNQHNRPMRETHANRISWLIKGERWRINGNSIKIDEDGNMSDGQHRCWGCIYANKSIVSVVVVGIKREAFATIDTMQAVRTMSDILVVAHDVKNRTKMVAGALNWLCHFEAGTIATFRKPNNRIENDMIEQAYSKHPKIADAVERVYKLGKLTNVSVLSFAYYLLSSRNQALANRFINAMEDPAALPLSDPFYMLRAALIGNKKRNPMMNIALIFKAANAANSGEQLRGLHWRVGGKNPEAFPELKV